MEPEQPPVRLGVILPAANTTLEAEAPSLLPAGVTSHFQRFNRLVRTEDDLEGAMAAMLDAATAVAAARVSAVGIGYTAGSYVGGLAWDASLRSAINDAVGAPTVTAASALTEGLHHLHAQAIAVISPYAKDVNDRLQRFFEGAGFVVRSVVGEPPPGPAGEVPLADIRAMVSRLDLAGADAVLISCTGLRTMWLVGELEEATGLPVISSNQALLWAIGRAAALELAGPGTLFARHGGG